MPINLDDLKPMSATFELRYAPQFMVWDRSGLIWSTIAAQYPKITKRKAEPNAVAVNLAPHLHAVVEIDKAIITLALPPADLAPLKEAAAVLVSMLRHHLPIEKYTRLGLRIIYHKTFPTQRAAEEYLQQCVALPSPSGKVMNVDGRMLEPAYSFRWEGEAIGFHLRLSAAHARIGMELPVEFLHLMPNDSDLGVNRAIVDIDYYSHAQVSVDQVRSDDLIDSWLKLIKRDMSKVFHGQH